jgi:hypothetical protein
LRQSKPAQNENKSTTKTRYKGSAVLINQQKIEKVAARQSKINNKNCV